MVRIRLKRLGKKRVPFYRIVVMDIRNRREGAPLEELGYYNPHSKELKLNKEAALSWIAKGAVPTETAQRLINKAPEGGQLVKLELVQKERLSKKAKAKIEADKKAAEEAKAAAAAEAAEAAKAAAEAPPAEEPAAAEEPVAEEAAAEA